MKYKFVIASFRQNCGGPIVLHRVCKCLEELGYNSKVFYAGDFSYKKNEKLKFWLNWVKFTLRDFVKSVIVKIDRDAVKKKPVRYAGYGYVPVRGCNRKIIPFVGKNTIVIYPDVVYGNPLGAKNVVRYLLYYNRFPDDPQAYGKDDLFVCFREQFNDYKLNPDGHKLYISYFDLNTYKRIDRGERKGTCYIIRKGADREDLPNSFDGPIIDDLSEEEKVNVFNRSEMCISYDTQTAYSGIAAMCGCLSVVVPESGKTRKDYLSGNDENYGVAYGFSDEEISYAKKTAHRIKEKYETNNADGLKSAEEFAQLCKEYFKIDK